MSLAIIARIERPFLFIYGTLRTACDQPGTMLAMVACHIGPASAWGTLYRVLDYPGFVPGPCATVAGDLFLLPPDPAVLHRIDEYEECTT